MRKQRNNQILRELEGCPELDGPSPHQLYDPLGDQDTFASRNNSAKPPSSLLATGDHHGSHQTVIPVKELEILGPDYCSKRPIFLPQHFPEMMIVGQSALSQLSAP